MLERTPQFYFILFERQLYNSMRIDETVQKIVDFLTGVPINK